jgi:hypothetical protein
VKPTSRPCSIRQQGWRRQARHQQSRQHLLQPGLHGKADGTTGQGGQEAENQEFAAVNKQQLARPGAHAAHHRAAIEMAPHVALGGKCHRDRGKDHGKQGCQAQKSLRALGDVANLGPGVVQAFQSLAAPKAGLRPGLEILYRFRLAGDMKAIADPGTGQDQPGGGQIAEIDHQARRQCEHVHAAIRLQRQDRSAAHLDLAQRQMQCRQENSGYWPAARHPRPRHATESPDSPHPAC